MKLTKNQKVFLKRKTVGRTLNNVLEINKDKKYPVPMIGKRYFGYWQHAKVDMHEGIINVVDYRQNSGSGDFYKDTDIVPVEYDFIPEELFEI